MKPGDVVLDRYRIEGRLGGGGMGEVYAARHESLGQPVAVKVLLDALARDPVNVSRFVREANAVSRLRGRHTVRMIDFGRLDDGLPVIVMERLEGEHLGELLRARKTLPAGEAVDLVLQAIEGVAEAHALGLVHRDLKPSNLFLAREVDGTPVVKVMDFGIVKSIDGLDDTRLTRTHAFIGSVMYAAPEQLRHRPVDARCNQWSLGVVLYELLSGRLPFSAESTTDASISIAMEPPAPLPPTVPAGLARVVLRCLEKEPDRRFKDATELASALAPFASHDGAERSMRIERVLAAAGSTTDASPAAAASMATLPGRRFRRRLAIAAGVGALVAAGGVAAAVILMDREQSFARPSSDHKVAVADEKDAPAGTPAQQVPATPGAPAAPVEPSPEPVPEAPDRTGGGEEPPREPSDRLVGQYRMVRPAKEPATQEPLEVARTAGVLGATAGFEDADIQGGLLGDEPGEMAGGFGFGRAGFGPGGGGTGWGTLGTGRYGTIGSGSGTGSGYGVGSGRGGVRGRAAAVPSMRMGAINSVGDLDKALIRRYLKRNITKLSYCYEKQLLARPSLEGTVSTQFFITSTGTVSESHASGVHDEVATCMAAVIKAIEFPKPKGGGGVQVNAPFTVRPTGGGQ